MLILLQEVFKEALIHLALCRQILDSKTESDEYSTTIEHIKSVMLSSTSRHGPIILLGGHGSGKTSLLTSIFSQSEVWFGKQLLRVLRFAGVTPRSSYNLELIRIICEHISLLLQPSGPCIPKDASFDPLYVNNWSAAFCSLVKCLSRVK